MIGFELQISGFNQATQASKSVVNSASAKQLNQNKTNLRSATSDGHEPIF